MAGDQPSSESPRPQPHRRTSSTLSLGKTAAGAGGQRAKTGKAHTVGKHNRNRSFGKDLHKLSRLTGNDDASVRPAAMARTSSNPGQASSSTANVKRNKSDVALLSRDGSRVHIKKNQSAVSLRRNDSHPKLKRNSRPTTPREQRLEDEAQNKHVQPAFTIDDEDEEDQEDEWTEESASVSPVVTRSGSMKGQRPNLQLNGARSGTTSPLKKDARAESPTTPVAEQPKSVRPALPTYESGSSRLPDPTIITNRLLRRTSTQQLAPKLSTISAGGSSGTQSPLHGESNGTVSSSQILNRTSLDSAQQSMPSEGVSRFLNPGTASSSGRNNYTSQMHDIMGQMRANGVRSRSPSPNPAADLKRAKSAVQMSGRDSRDPRRVESQVDFGGDQQDDDPRSYTVDPSLYRRRGDNTLAKMELWRTQSSVEPNAGPPVAVLRGTHGHAIDAQRYMGAEERRIRMAEEAEAELAYLRRYRNPAIDSFERVRAQRKKQEKSKKRTSMEDRSANGVPAAQNKSRRSDRRQKNSQDTDTPNGSLGTTIAGSAGTQGRRSVRFSVGADGNDEQDNQDDVTEEARLASLLRSMWYGGEGDAASVD